MSDSQDSRCSEGACDLRDLVDDLDIVLWEADPRTFAFTYVSRGAEAMLGYPVQAWLADPDFWRTHIHPEDRGAAVALCEAATRQGMDHDFDYRMIASDGSVRWVRDLVRVKKDAAGRVTLLRGVLCDRTARRLAGEAIREYERRLEQAAKMEAMGRLAAGIAHDFNNVLTLIGNTVELLADDIHDKDPRADDLAQIRRAVRSGAALTRQMLSLGRNQPMRRQVVEVNAALTELHRLLQRALGSSIHLSTRLHDTPLHVNVDPSLLEHALINLALNASDAMPGGGSLTIQATTALLDSAWAPHNASRARHALIVVSDTGEGMDEETRRHIFEPFFTTKPGDKGTGLGLAMVYGVVEQHGGTIVVESAPGRGSAFKLYFPLVEKPHSR